MTRVNVKPELLRWARERAGVSLDVLAGKFPKLPEWELGTTSPTLKQIEKFATTVHAPIGYFFLQEPPVEQIPIPDLRTIGNEFIDHPSPDVLDTIYLCQQRQEWFREFARAEGHKALQFVGSIKINDDIEKTAEKIRNNLGFDIEERRQSPTWTDALRRFIEQADTLGVLVMVSGVVGSNNWRKLDPREFRGFAITDALAPLVFINGADTKAAQMFTLAHELAHIWLGQSALTDIGPISSPSDRTEEWCNRIAAEVLVPLNALKDEYRKKAALSEEKKRLARVFKVSTLVILRRIHDAGGLTKDQLWRAYNEELEHLKEIMHRGGGGNFYLTLGARASKRFARALVVSTLEGRSSFTEALRLLGFKKMGTFRELGYSLGVSF